MILFCLKQTRRLMGFVPLLLGLIVTPWPQPLFSQTVRSQEETARILVIGKLTIQDGTVSGEIQNRSSRTVRDAQLFIRYTWLWDDEFNPGKDDPGTSAYHTVPGEIPPSGTTLFKFTPTPPLPKRSGGHFETSVSIAGFTEIIPQGK